MEMELSIFVQIKFSYLQRFALINFNNPRPKHEFLNLINISNSLKNQILITNQLIYRIKVNILSISLKFQVINTM